MNSKELLYITTIAELGSISRAAEKLYISQSTLSRCLQKVENELNACLFKRMPAGLIPTNAGDSYLAYTKQILKISRDMENTISQINHMQTGHLVIGTTTHLSMIVLPDILRTFGGTYPGIEIELVENDPYIIESKLLDGTIDLALMHLPLTNLNIKYQKIAEEDLLLIIPSNDPLNEIVPKYDNIQLPLLDLQLISNRSFILTHPSQGTRKAAQRILNTANIKPQIKYETRNIQTVIRLVSFGLGISIVPHSYYKILSSSFESIKCYRIAETYAPYWDLAICYLSVGNEAGAAHEFINICKATLPYLFKN